MNYLLPFQFLLNFGNSCVQRDVSSNCKSDSCYGSLACTTSILSRFGVRSGNHFNFLCCNTYFKLLFVTLIKERDFNDSIGQ